MIRAVTATKARSMGAGSLLAAAAVALCLAACGGGDSSEKGGAPTPGAGREFYGVIGGEPLPRRCDARAPRPGRGRHPQGQLRLGTRAAEPRCSLQLVAVRPGGRRGGGERDSRPGDRLRLPNLGGAEPRIPAARLRVARFRLLRARGGRTLRGRRNVLEGASRAAGPADHRLAALERAELRVLLEACAGPEELPDRAAGLPRCGEARRSRRKRHARRPLPHPERHRHARLHVRSLPAWRREALR